VWLDELLNNDFRYVFDKVLSPVEREITMLKIDGHSDTEIIKHLHIKLTTLKRRFRDIKFKYRNQIESRVDQYINSPSALKRYIKRTEKFLRKGLTSE